MFSSANAPLYKIVVLSVNNAVFMGFGLKPVALCDCACDISFFSMNMGGRRYFSSSFDLYNPRISLASLKITTVCV